MPTPLREPPSQGRPRSSRLSALLDRKLTPGIFLLFFVALAIMCAAAAGVGYVAREMRAHVETRR